MSSVDAPCTVCELLPPVASRQPLLLDGGGDVPPVFVALEAAAWERAIHIYTFPSYSICLLLETRPTPVSPRAHQCGRWFALCSLHRTVAWGWRLW